MERIFQVFINDSGALPEFSGHAARAMQSVRASFPGAAYRLPGGTELRELQNAIDAIVRNCKSRYYGVTPLCPTGPTLLGRAVCEEDAPSVVCPGELTELTPRHPQQNPAYVLDGGQIVALAKPAPGGDLKSLGLAGTNNYNEFWKARNVYDPVDF